MTTKFTYRISDIFESYLDHTLQFYHCKCFKYENGVFSFFVFYILMFLQRRIPHESAVVGM